MKKFSVLAILFMVAAFGPVKAQKWGSNPEDSAACVMNTSLYSESYKMKDYVGAYEPWHEVVKNCPKSSKNLYIRGVAIMEAKINAAANAEEREALIEELMALYDTRVAVGFGEAGNTLGAKAMELEKIVGAANVQRYYPIYRQAMEVGGENIDANYAYKFFEATINYVVRGHAETTLVVDNYDIASTVLEKELRTTEDTVKAANIRKYLANVENAFSPYASCDQLVSIYGKKFEASPNDLDLLKKITNIMTKKKCTSEELFFKASQNQHKLEPTPTTAFLMGTLCLSNKKFSEAADYLAEAAKGQTDEDELYRTYMYLGAAYQGSHSYSQARTAYNKASDLNPKSGEPLLRIAQLYAASAGSTPDGMGGGSAYWAAVDQANRAKAVDSSEENVAACNKLIGQCAGRFPSQEKAFFLNIMDGQGFTVPGWIGVHTTVRTRK